MAVDLNNLPPPTFDQEIRSAIQLVRRMMLLRWSVGSYLTAIGGNLGIPRPPLGFGDDDFFRACVQYIAADYKSIGRAFWQLLEISLGPYQTLNAQLEQEGIQGAEYVVVRGEDADRLPLYGACVLDPSGLLEQVNTITTVDRYRKRVRLRQPLANTLPIGTVLRVEGGCWDFIETKARRVSIRVNCALASVLRTLLGHSYLHGNTTKTARLRETVQAGDTVLLLDDNVLEGIDTALSYPLPLYLNPEFDLDQVPFLRVEASSYNATTRTFILSSPIPANTIFPRGTSLRWYQAQTGEVLDAALIGATEVVARLKQEDVAGLWRLASSVVFVKESTYQKRQLCSEIQPSTTQILIDHPLKTPLVVGFDVLVFSDTTGVLGSATILSTQGQEIVFTGAAGFSTNILLRAVTVEVVRGLDFGVRLTLDKPLTVGLSPLDSVLEWFGSVSQPSEANPLVAVSWPNPLTPDGSWPSCYVYDLASRYPSNNQGTGLVLAQVDQSDPNDARIYLGRSVLVRRYDPSTSAIGPMGVQTVGGVNYTPKTLHVADASVFASVAVMAAWQTSPSNPRFGYPERVVISGEGGFGRSPVYLWGADASKRELYVSGLERVHLEGVAVVSLCFELPVESVVGTFGSNQSLSNNGGEIILDHGTQEAEEIDFETLQLRTPTRALLTFERGYQPSFSHNPLRVSTLDNTSILGVLIAKADRYATPLQNGYSFPLTLGGGMLLQRLAFLLNLVKAAGVKVDFYDEKDALIDLSGLLL